MSAEPLSRLPAETRVPEGLDDVAERLAEQLPQTLDWLRELVRIPSISVQPEHVADCRRSAEATADRLRDAGLEDVRLLELDGTHPYVTGSWVHAGEDAPTVLLYAHHDVQPVGTPDRWSSAPFAPTERDGRLYGRGSADDKAGILAHVAAIRAWLDARGSLPVNVKVVVEGEEEIGSPNLQRFLARHGAALQADVIVLTDLTNWQVGWPGLTYALRGMADVTVTVRAMQQPVHSGMWGGVVPDALTGTVRLLASLHDDTGAIAVAGFEDDVRPLGEDERARLAELEGDGVALAEDFRRDARLVPGAGFVGDDRRTVLERLWMRPTITPTGMDVPAVADAANTLLAQVRTKLSCRLAPGQDPERALAALRRHLEANVPWGLEVEVVFGERNPAWVTEPGGPAWDAAVAAMTAAYGRAPAAMGCGGSIPFVEPFSDAFGGAPCLLVGVEDPGSNAHGEDESLHLEDFAKACLTEAFLLAGLAEVPTA
ncbi:M20/M25/M40 family metallo-hydrolase [Egicoccus halophilus]|uniref:Dipeptidase n=1 Tax=Egicoccus halophilus TaxID=1670830 RepID=A0A8J3ABQ4_9ACTN|nr:M20/M25/M40 family metallo-hydrolase [Egicoccus halophilus]GGI07682.1 dipeptidase [Egicoccus halophilus]